ncbi:MAG: efflux RND transporter permease subunit [Fibrobacterota bacterium]
MKKMIAWMAQNHVTANLLMLLIIVAGLTAYFQLPRKVFPDAEIPVITVTVPYPGAAPDKIEESIVMKFESALVSVNGVRRISSSSTEGMGSIFLELEDDVDMDEVKNEVNSEIDRITDLPDDAEEAVVTRMEIEIPVMELGLYGGITEQELKDLAERVKNELRGKSEISKVEVYGTRSNEVSIEVSQKKLEAYNLTFHDVSTAISRGSMDLPGGKIRTEKGEILVRTRDLAEDGAAFGRIIVKTTAEGSRIRVSDVADVKDSFEDSNLYTGFDGREGALLVVSRTGTQSALKVAKQVKEYVKEKNKTLPEGVDLIVWDDMSRVLKSRIGLLVKNGALGFALVVLVLGFFLDIRLSFWVAVGMVLSFMGGLWAMLLFDVSINLISLFGFIMVLGIVVDDAIVVGESIFRAREAGEKPVAASKIGTTRIAVPVIFAVLTTVATFSPLLTVEGVSGQIMYAVPIVVISVLLFSLLESIFILPSHLSGLHLKSRVPLLRWSHDFSEKVDSRLRRFVERRYIPLLRKSMQWPTMVIAGSIALLMIFIGLIVGGRIDVKPGMGSTEGVSIKAFVEMPTGTAIHETRDVTDSIFNALERVKEKFLAENPDKKGSFYRHVFVSIGQQPSKGLMNNDDPTIAEVNILFPAGQERDYSLEPIQNMLREETRRIGGYESLTFSNAMRSAGEDINISLSYHDRAQLVEAALRLEDTLATYSGVYDISDDYELGKEEVQLELKDRGRHFGITLSDVALQVRTAFYGDEALRFQRGENDVPAMIRLTGAERGFLQTLFDMKIRTPRGAVPLTEVAHIRLGRGYSKINRINQNRVVTVTANVDENVSNPTSVNSEMVQFIEGEMQKEYPGISLIIGGEQEDTARSLKSLGVGYLVALFVVYILLAIPFKSYLEPFVIMAAIPFGAIGAFIGHVVLGYDLQMMSIFGIVALSGVVVNDSLVFVDFVNGELDRGLSIRESIVAAGRTRFRPILLTTVTTFAGLLPMLFEQSFQARMLIPMAISLGVGILFASAITLFLVPAYLILLYWVRAFFGIHKDGSAEALNAD